MRTRDKLAQNRQEKATIEQHLSETERDLSATERTLATTNQKLATAAQKLTAEEDRAKRLERKLEREGDRRMELQGEIAALDVRLSAEASKTEELQDAVAQAVAARSRAELELEFAEEELAALRKRSVSHVSEPESDPSTDEPSPDS
jgi:chromosome segregation ATPase